jgi:hypothetical protein
MPTSFLGLFLLSTALSLVASFTATGVQALLRRVLSAPEEQKRVR